MSRWRNEAGEELTVPLHSLIECTTLHDERRQFCIGGFAWISTLERLPEPDTEVLGWAGFCVIVTYFPDRGKWFDGEFCGYNVTAWMPLPSGPLKRFADIGKGG